MDAALRVRPFIDAGGGRAGEEKGEEDQGQLHSRMVPFCVCMINMEAIKGVRLELFPFRALPFDLQRFCYPI